MSESASPPRISRLRVKNFRSIAEIDIPLGPLTVLIGPNGSGKSNVVDALRFVRDVFTRGLDQAVLDREGMDVIRRWAPVGEEGGEVKIEVTVIAIDEEIVYGFGLGKTPSSDFTPTAEYLVVDTIEHPVLKVVRIDNIIKATYNPTEPIGLGDSTTKVNLLFKPLGLFTESTNLIDLPDFHEGDSVQDFELNNEYWELREIVDALEKTINNSYFYGLNPADLRQPQRSLLETPLDEHGRNLAAVLRRLHRTDGEALEELRTVLRRTVAGFDDLTVETVGGYLAPKLLYTSASGEPRASYLGQESDGTIRMLGILAALLQEPAQPVVAIEEPEANIHPGALGVLAETFLEASKRGQIILTTHSPDLMTHLPAECFLIVEKVDGETRVGPLNTEQAEIVRQHLFSAGELMRMQGLHRQDSAAS